MRHVFLVVGAIAYLVTVGRADSLPPESVDAGIPLPAPPTEDPFAPAKDDGAANNPGPVKDFPAPEVSNPTKSAPSPLPQESLKPLAGPPVTVNSSPTDGTNLTAGDVLMNSMDWEALPGSQNWRSRWNAPDFGCVSVLSAPLSANRLRAGTIVPWRKSAQGIPEVVLRAVIYLPDLSIIKPTDSEVATASTAVDIRQYVTFYPVEKTWKAVASPYYVLRENKDSTSSTLLPVNAGKGAWTACLGPGGLVVKNFIEGGLGAARVPFVRNFREEEIQWFLTSDTDVVFYLRPKK